MTTVFYISATVAVFATLMVITRLNALHALLYLIVSLLAVAVAFFTLGAPFAAALEVIIYAGAIMVLLLFVIMLLNPGSEALKQERKRITPGMWPGPLIMILILISEFIWLISFGTRKTVTVLTGLREVAPARVGESLFSTYLLGAELAGMLLLTGLIGAWHIGRRFQDHQRRKSDI
jgi:NADH-quinone oxidoreductase subunit J